MGRTILAVCMSGLLTAACAPPSLGDQVGERVLIRNGFVVPSGKLLLVDDISVDCVIASEVFDEAEFHKVGVEFDSVPAHRLSDRCLSRGPRLGRRVPVTGLRGRHRSRTWPEGVVHPARPARQARLEGRRRTRDECICRCRSYAARCLSGRSGQHHQLFHRRQRPAGGRSLTLRTREAHRRRSGVATPPRARQGCRTLLEGPMETRGSAAF